MSKPSSSAWYFLSFFLGVLIVVFYIFVLSYFEFFSAGATTYPAFITFILAYALFGWILGNILPGDPVKHAINLALPMWIFFFFLNFGDSGPREVLPRWLAALSPFAAHLGARFVRPK